eukprot:2354215-Prymnesium_polylepis.2
MGGGVEIFPKEMTWSGIPVCVSTWRRPPAEATRQSPHVSRHPHLRAARAANRRRWRIHLFGREESRE